MANGRASRKDGYPTRWTEESCQRFFQMLREKKSSKEIEEELGYSKSSIDNAIVLLSIAGPEAFIKSKVYQKFTEYSRYDLCCIVETMLHNGITSLSEIAAYFNCRTYKLISLIKQRNELQEPLEGATPKALPPRLEHEFFDVHRKVRQASKALASTKAKKAKQPLHSNFHEPDTDRVNRTVPLSAAVSPAAERPTDQLTEEEIAEIRRLLAEYKQSHSLDSKEQITHQIASVYEKAYIRQQAELRQQAEETFNELVATIQRTALIEHAGESSGISAKDLDIEKWRGEGEHPIVNIDSEGFSDLPNDIREDVYIHQIKSYAAQAAILKMQVFLISEELKTKEVGLTDLDVKKLKFFIAKAFNTANNNRIPVTSLSKWSGLTRREYNYYNDKPLAEVASVFVEKRNTWKYSFLKAKILLAFTDGGCSQGVNSLTKTLQLYYGVAPGRDLVRKLMNAMGLRSRKNPSPLCAP